MTTSVRVALETRENVLAVQALNDRADSPEFLFQAELDNVLLNWGNSASVATHLVPEPASLCLILLAIACGQIRNRHRFGR